MKKRGFLELKEERGGPTAAATGGRSSGIPSWHPPSLAAAKRVNILHPKASTSYCPLSSARHALKRKKYRWESELGGDPVGFVKKGEKKVFVIDFDYVAKGA